MRKSHYKSHFATFQMLEDKVLADYGTRRPLNSEEIPVVELLRTFKLGEDEMTPEQIKILEPTGLNGLEVEEFVGLREEILKEATRMENYLRPGKKYPLMARNPARVRAGRRFAYVGVDGAIHVARRGKPLKVAMAVE
jgi:hypothetical protein